MVNIEKPTYVLLVQEKVFITVPALLASILAIGAATLTVFRLLSIGIDQFRNKWGWDRRSREERFAAEQSRKSRGVQESLLEERQGRSEDGSPFPGTGGAEGREEPSLALNPVQVERTGRFFPEDIDMEAVPK